MFGIYKIYIIFNNVRETTECSIYYNGNVIEYDLILGKDPFIECMYYWKINNLNTNNSDSNLLQTWFIFESRYKQFYDDLKSFLFKHNCALL